MENSLEGLAITVRAPNERLADGTEASLVMLKNRQRARLTIGIRNDSASRVTVSVETNTPWLNIPSRQISLIGGQSSDYVVNVDPDPGEEVGFIILKMNGYSTSQGYSVVVVRRFMEVEDGSPLGDTSGFVGDGGQEKETASFGDMPPVSPEAEEPDVERRPLAYMAAARLACQHKDVSRLPLMVKLAHRRGIVLPGRRRLLLNAADAALSGVMIFASLLLMCRWAAREEVSSAQDIVVLCCLAEFCIAVYGIGSSYALLKWSIESQQWMFLLTFGLCVATSLAAGVVGGICAMVLQAVPAVTWLGLSGTDSKTNIENIRMFIIGCAGIAGAGLLANMIRRMLETTVAFLMTGKPPTRETHRALADEKELEGLRLGVWVTQAIRVIGRHHGPAALGRVCPPCAARITANDDPVLNMTYPWCRSCGRIYNGDKAYLQVSHIVACLSHNDHRGKHCRDGILYVNWFDMGKPFDFDRVQITDASDSDIEEFIIKLRNDTDALRKERYHSMPCTLKPSCVLSRQTQNQLKDFFRNVQSAN